MSTQLAPHIPEPIAFSEHNSSMCRVPALSIQSPWAQQILRPSHQPGLGHKWCENRTWTTTYRGRLLIHQSGRNGAILGEVTLLEVLCSYGRDDEDCHQALRRLRRTVCDIYGNAGLPRPTRWTSADPFEGYWWLLAHPHKFAHPIPCGGRLRLWWPDPALRRKIAAARADSLAERAIQTTLE